jgi:hypothetical protein
VYIFRVDSAGKLPPNSPASAALQEVLALAEAGLPLVVHHAQTVVRYLATAGVHVDGRGLSLAHNRPLFKASSHLF